MCPLKAIIIVIIMAKSAFRNYLKKLKALEKSGMSK